VRAAHAKHALQTPEGIETPEILKAPSNKTPGTATSVASATPGSPAGARHTSTTINDIVQSKRRQPLHTPVHVSTASTSASAAAGRGSAQIGAEALHRDSPLRVKPAPFGKAPLRVRTSRDDPRMSSERPRRDGRSKESHAVQRRQSRETARPSAEGGSAITGSIGEDAVANPERAQRSHRRRHRQPEERAESQERSRTHRHSSRSSRRTSSKQKPTSKRDAPRRDRRPGTSDLESTRGYETFAAALMRCFHAHRP